MLGHRDNGEECPNVPDSIQSAPSSGDFRQPDILNMCLCRGFVTLYQKKNDL